MQNKSSGLCTIENRFTVDKLKGGTSQKCHGAAMPTFYFARKTGNLVNQKKLTKIKHHKKEKRLKIELQQAPFVIAIHGSRAN